MPESESASQQGKKVVVKIGTSSLIHENGELKITEITALAEVLSQLRKQGYQILLVSSGAVGAGMNQLGIRERPDEIAELQALSAIGQVHLMALYDRIFGAFHQQVAQVLLTRDVVDYPHSRQNVWQTLAALLTNGVIPIINENDAVSVDEFDHQTTFGENDQLAAVVSHLVDADLLIIMSDIDGLYDANPKHHPDAHLIPWVAQVDEHLLGSAEGPGSQFGSGGMATKLRAADLVLKHGGQMALVNGDDPQNVVRALNDQPVGTRFSAKKPKYL